MEEDKTKNKIISVIVPVFNVVEYLPACLDSILAQSYSDFELLLIDDGSNDGSELLCDEYSNRDSRIRVVHKSNGGVSSARNVGLQIAVGEWIMFVDADDLLPQDTILSYTKVLELSRTDTVISQWAELDYHGILNMPPHIVSSTYIGDKSEQFIGKAISDFGMSVWGGIYKKTLFDGLLFPEGIPNYEDCVICWQIAMRSHSYSVIDNIGYIVRHRQGSASRARIGLVTYRKRIISLKYLCKKLREYFADMKSVSRALSKLVIVEGLACKDLYRNFNKEEKEEVVLLTNELWECMKQNCDIPWYMKRLLSLRVKLLRYNINGFPFWQYAPIRLALRLM